jgi:signal transduction histidine kinase
VVGTNVNARRVLERVRQIADQTSTRVTVLLVNTRNGEIDVSPTYDSFQTNEIDLDFGVALQSARSGRPQTGTETGDSGRVGQVARPLFQRDPEGRRLLGYVAVFSTQLRDVESSVDVVERRVLIAGGAAASIALLAGILMATGLTRRVRQIETAAGRVAAGDFDARFPLDRSDELGQLSRALDDMRRQLAELDNARKRFIATASHELRTPIFSSAASSSSSPTRTWTRDARHLPRAGARAGRRLGKLATELLDLSKLEAGSLELRPEPTDLTGPGPRGGRRVHPGARGPRVPSGAPPAARTSRGDVRP